MPTRRSLPKSHHGCNQCKQRRVKCDEKRPKCSNCTKRGTVCIFRDFPALRFQAGRASSRSPASSSSSLSRSGHTKAIAVDTAQELVPEQKVEPMSYSEGSLQAMGLIHHYTCFAAKTLTENASLEALWREHTPRQALKHPFLLHGVLAVSALHLSHGCQETAAKYRAVAIQHQNTALSLFRTQLVDRTRSNGFALFIFSCVAIVSTFAIEEPSADYDSHDPLSDLWLIYELSQGADMLWKECSEWAKDGPLGKFMSMKLGRTDPDESDASEACGAEGSAALEALEAHIAPEKLSTSRTNFSICSRKCYAETFKGMKNCLIETVGHNSIHRWAIAWLGRNQKPFVSALQQREELALAILAFYGVMLHYGRHKWWIGARGALLVQQIATMLGPEWDDVMTWPKKHVGLLPDDHIPHQNHHPSTRGKTNGRRHTSSIATQG